MSVIPLDTQHITDALVGDAQYVRAAINLLEQRRAMYAALVNEGVLTGAGVSAGDLPYVTAFISGIGRIVDAANGQALSAVDPIDGHIIHILGTT